MNQLNSHGHNFGFGPVVVSHASPESSNSLIQRPSLASSAATVALPVATNKFTHQQMNLQWSKSLSEAISHCQQFTINYCNRIQCRCHETCKSSSMTAEQTNTPMATAAHQSQAQATHCNAFTQTPPTSEAELLKSMMQDSIVTEFLQKHHQLLFRQLSEKLRSDLPLVTYSRNEFLDIGLLQVPNRPCDFPWDATTVLNIRRWTPICYEKGHVQPFHALLHQSCCPTPSDE